MVRLKKQYVCQNCGYVATKWLGRCPACQTWDAFEEVVATPPAKATAVAAEAARAAVQRLDQVSTADRWVSGLGEWDRVLGGGLLPGSVYLIGGDPGIGKSTLMLQVLDRYLAVPLACLYVAGEESAEQIRQRAERLGLNLQGLLVFPDACLEDVLAVLDSNRFDVVVVDSIQMLYTRNWPSPPGTVRQIRECGLALIQQAKQRKMALLFVGHVTKEGFLAGPKLLEHMVDGVLYFEGDRYYSFRVLRAVKNRFGPVQEVGIFEMTEQGLREVPNPSLMWLDMEALQARVGAILCPILEGARTLIIEVQALVAPTVYAAGRRTALGIDLGRLHIVSAVLERRLGYPLSRFDVYAKLTAGFQSRDPALDLAVALAMASSYSNRPIPVRWAALGELALTGEVRPVPYTEQRLQALARLGVETCFAPPSRTAGPTPADLRVLSVRRVEEAIERFEGWVLDSTDPSG